MARGDLAGTDKGAEAQQRTIFIIVESGFYPLSRVIRTDSPVSQIPILRGRWTRDPLFAISAVSAEGERSFQSQARSINADDVGACLEPLGRERPGQRVIICEDSPILRSRSIHAFLTHGASPRLHLARLRAYAPELNLDEGVWPHLTGVEPIDL